MLSIGIIGCGTITRLRHAPEYANNPTAKITAFADAVPGRAAEMALQYGGDAYEDYHALLTRPDIDAVSVCTANQTHAVIAREALIAGKHVLCEKPMALSLEEAAVLCAVAKQTEKILMPAHNQRLFSSHTKAHDILQSGRLGRVIAFISTFQHSGPENWSIDKGGKCWFFSKEAGNGVLSDLGVHKLDVINYLLGEPITQISADLSTLDKRDERGAPIMVCDSAALLCATASGIHGVVLASWINYGREENTTTLYCEKGRMLINPSQDADLVIETHDGQREVINLGGIPTNDAQKSSGMIDAFLDTILGRRPPIATPEDGYTSIAAMDAALRSASQNQGIQPLQTLID